MKNQSSKGKKLFKNTIILFLGKICTQFINFLLLPIYTTYMSQKLYGTFDLLQNYVIVLIPIVNLEIEMAVYKFLIESKKNKISEHDVIFNSYYYSFVLALIAFIVFIIFSVIFKSKVILYTGILLIVNIFLNVNMQICRGKGNNVNYSIACVVSAFCNISLCIIFLIVFKLDILGAIFSSIISNIICILFIFMKEKIFFNLKNGKKDRTLIKQMLKYSVPLIPSAIIWWIVNVSDRTLISIFLGSSSNGIYAVANKFPSIISSIFNIFVLSWTEIVFLYINDDYDGFISKTFNTVVRLLIGLCLLLSSSMFVLFPLFINKKFEMAYGYILPLIYATFFSNIVALLGPIYLAKNKTKEIAKTSIASGILNIIINFIFIRYIGVWAAVVSTIISFALVAIFRFFDVKKYIALNIEFKYIYIIFFGFILNIILYYINNFLFNVLNLMLMLLIFILLNKELILNKIGRWKR